MLGAQVAQAAISSHLPPLLEAELSELSVLSGLGGLAGRLAWLSWLAWLGLAKVAERAGLSGLAGLPRPWAGLAGNRKGGGIGREKARNALKKHWVLYGFGPFL